MTRKRRNLRAFIVGFVIGLIFLVMIPLLVSCDSVDGDIASPPRATEQVGEDVQPLKERWIEKVDCLDDICVYALRGKYTITCYVAVYDPQIGESAIQMACP